MKHDNWKTYSGLEAERPLMGLFGHKAWTAKAEAARHALREL
jgi:hypothetical protein